jgi:hypothetical protein
MFEGGGAENYYKTHVLGFFFILQIWIKMASTVPCFKPGNQKKYKTDLPCQKTYFGRAPLNKNKKKRQLVVHRSGAKRGPMQSWHVYIDIYFFF